MALGTLLNILKPSFLYGLLSGIRKIFILTKILQIFGRFLFLIHLKINGFVTLKVKNI